MLDSNADEYVRDIFGNQFVVIDMIERLPEKLPQLFCLTDQVIRLLLGNAQPRMYLTAGLLSFVVLKQCSQ